MGKSAARLGDIGSNHGAWHPTPVISGSGDVTINGRPAARKGDALLPHIKPKSPPHGRTIGKGSSSVTINGKPAARVGDSISCGGNISTGSGDVTIGDAVTLTPPDDASLPDITFNRKHNISEHIERKQAPIKRTKIAETAAAEQTGGTTESQKPSAKKQISISLSG